MAYINKIVVNGNEVNANQFEGILDKDGHARFVEGNLGTETISGVTYNYAKWSLSGSHLMLVLAGTIDSGVTISNATPLGFASLPEWIYNKVYPVGEGSVDNIISYQDFNLIGVNTFDRVNEQFYLYKYNSNLNIAKSGSITTTQKLYFRVQFDLVIDNE